MKYKCKPEKIRKSKYKWHDWFAWRPVWCDDDENGIYVWLETVERRKQEECFLLDSRCWMEYRLPKGFVPIKCTIPCRDEEEQEENNK